VVDGTWVHRLVSIPRSQRKAMDSIHVRFVLLALHCSLSVGDSGAGVGTASTVAGVAQVGGRFALLHPGAASQLPLLRSFDLDRLVPEWNARREATGIC